MEYITIALGLFAGVLFGKRLAEHTLFLYYHYKHLNTRERFLDIYNLVDSEFHYEIYCATTDNPPAKYSDYLKKHQQLESKSYKIYKHYVDKLESHTIKIVLSIVIFPAIILFWTTWYYFLISFVVVYLGFLLFIRYKKDNGIDFHAILLVSLIFNHKEK